MSARLDMPELILPAPWGAAVALGLVKVLPMPAPTLWRGLIKVTQTVGGSPSAYRHRMNCFLRAAHKKRWRMGREISPTLCSRSGLVGWTEVTHCVDLRRSSCPYTWEDHYNAGEHECEPWAWVLADPFHATQADTKPPRSHHTQQVLFAGV